MDTYTIAFMSLFFVSFLVITIINGLRENEQEQRISKLEDNYDELLKICELTVEAFKDFTSALNGASKSTEQSENNK